MRRKVGGREGEKRKNVSGCCMNPIWPHQRFWELGDIAIDPGHVAHHPGVYTREVRKPTASAPAVHTHLDPETVLPAYQGAPRVRLWKKAGISTPKVSSQVGVNVLGKEGAEERGWVRLLPCRSPSPPSQHKACHL